MAQPIRFASTVERVVRHTPDVVSYRLHADRRLPAFVPGQFVHLSIDHYDPSGFWPESRAFSVANAVTDRCTVDLTISRQGRYTGRILDSLREGDRVWMKGPYGDFAVGGQQDIRRAVLIAGGTGITPFCAFMDCALAVGELPLDEVILHYGARTPDLLIYRGLAEQSEERFAGFQANFYAEGEVRDESVRTGRPDPQVVVEQAGDAAGTAFYLSGPRPMIEGFRSALVRDFRMASERVIVDAWE